MWKYSNPDKNEDDENCWKLQPPSAIDGFVDQISVSYNKNVYMYVIILCYYLLLLLMIGQKYPFDNPRLLIVSLSVAVWFSGRFSGCVHS